MEAIERISRSLICFVCPLALLLVFPWVEHLSKNIVYSTSIAPNNSFFVHLGSWLIFLYLAKLSHFYISTTADVSKIHHRVSSMIAVLILATSIISLIIATILVIYSL
ncbi:MAG: hypothetical protein AAFZ89_15590 [Bacteroidota bacterium]